MIDPTPLQQIKNLVDSTIKHIISGAHELNEEEQQARINICNSCQFFNHQYTRCQKCGCNMAVKKKWASASCPIDLWGKGKDVK